MTTTGGDRSLISEDHLLLSLQVKQIDLNPNCELLVQFKISTLNGGVIEVNYRDGDPIDLLAEKICEKGGFQSQEMKESFEIMLRRYGCGMNVKAEPFYPS